MATIAKRRNRYVIDCYDQHGKRYRKTLPEGTTKQRARELLRDVEGKIERRTFAHEKKILTFAQVGQEWLEYKKTRCRETTWEMYLGHLKNHFADLNGKRIDLIITATVEKFITSRQAEMSLGSLRKIIVTLNQVISYAVRHKMLDFNPARDAERPKSTGKVDETREFKILTPEQIPRLLEAEPDEKYKTLFLVAVMTGARQGEILGLKWSNIDFGKKQMQVRQTFNHDRWFEPKTRGSIRNIDLSPMVIKALAEWKLKSGGQGLVFPSEAGTPLGCFNVVRRHFVPALKKAGLPVIRFHDLRHTYASLLLSQGENIKYVQNQLGHSSPTVTLNVYAHLMKSENQEAVCKLENTIFSSNRSQFGHK